MTKKERQKVIATAESLYSERRHEEIIELLITLDEVRTDYTLAMMLARALNDVCENMDDAISSAAEMLLLQFMEGLKDPAWHYELARSYFFRSRSIEAYRQLKSALELAEKCESFDKTAAEEMFTLCEADIKTLGAYYNQKQKKVVLEHITRYFGEITRIIPDDSPIGMNIEIAEIAADEIKDYRKLVTVGVGAFKMPSPFESEINNRMELVMYLPANANDFILKLAADYLRTIARLPIERNTWVAYGHIFTNSQPIAPDTELCASMIISVQDNCNESGYCAPPDLSPITFYQVVPLYREEVEYKLANSISKLINKMEDISAVLDLHRENVCEGFTIPEKNVVVGEEIDYVSELEIGRLCAVSRQIISDGCKVGYMRRVLLDDSLHPFSLVSDSGWIFMTGKESQAYLSSPDNVVICSLNTVCNIDSDVVPFLTEPYNTVVSREADGVLRIQPDTAPTEEFFLS